MTRDEIKAQAQQLKTALSDSVVAWVDDPVPMLEHILSVVHDAAVASEREACAQAVEGKGAEHAAIAAGLKRNGSAWAATAHDQFARVLSGKADSAAMRIRSRGQR